VKKYTIQTSTTLYLYTTIEAESEEQALELANERDFSQWNRDYDLGACDSAEVIDTQDITE
jgi:hypothetical protein